MIPAVGFGTWNLPAGEATVNAVVAALRSGVKHIDTARGLRRELNGLRIGRTIAWSTTVSLLQLIRGVSRRLASKGARTNFGTPGSG